ncbi:hypothetical protein KUTeg_008177 [Tegillarca granosa]|uniref:Uncharacterized protein n=1 Tax=Tegillarca granosa TaxID=220873 RepID=A0ABQ9FBJ0_TEGGR|nr:hypothetical protein KUTeg_008177 [Tegillarca granosa]
MVSLSKNEVGKETAETTGKIDLCIDPIVEKNIIIQSTHRIPHNPKDTYKPSMPEPIIVKFARMCDRNLVLSHVKNLKHAIQSLIIKRSKISRLAYQLRKNKGLKTAIRKTNYDVWLETRHSTKEQLEKYVSKEH